MEFVADITQPSIFGYAVTPWLIILLVSFIGTIVFLCLLIAGLSGLKKKESQMIEKANRNNAKIPVKHMEVPVMNTGNISYERTQAELSEGSQKIVSRVIADEKTEGITYNDSTKALVDDRTEGLDDSDKTEAIIDSDKTEGINDYTSKMTVGLTEGLSNNNVGRANFCWKCGNKVTGNFCSKCGAKI